MLFSIFNFAPARSGLASLPMNNKTAMIPERPIVGEHVRYRRLKTTTLVSAVALGLLGACFNAQALALGAVSVKSALGEPLRAEIEVPQISSEEAAGFKAAVASRQAFQAAGVEYTQAMIGVRVTLHRRASGEAYLRLEGDRPIIEPFLSIVIDAEWGNDGRITRDYTMLVDPPARSAPRVDVNPPRQQGARINPPTQTVAVPPPVETPRRAALASNANDQVTVQRGDTAMSIAKAFPIDGISLDQMLIALLRANPNAVINGNVNLMKAGAVLNMPTAEQAKSVSRQAARRAFVAQVHAFKDYRTGVAHNVRRVPDTSSGRSVSGSVQVRVPEESRASAPRDVVIVGGGSSAASNAEVAVAQSRQAQEQREREAELERTRKELEDLQKGAAVAAAQSALETPTASGGIQVPTGSVVPAPPAPPIPAASPAEEASTPTSVSTASTEQSASIASQATPSQPAPASAPQPPKLGRPASGPSLIERLSDNALPLAGGAILVLVLAALGFYRWRQGRQSRFSLNSSFSESRLQPDSFFGASGGQRIDTRTGESSAGTGNASSLMYSPSQIDAAGDVDPVAEADVYLAYGRDQQAEEILKEALRTHPGRISIHRKLAEIYARRRDAHALQNIAVEAYDMAHGSGPDWQAIVALGNELDPDNPLYKQDGAPAIPSALASATSPVRGGFGADTQPQSEAPEDHASTHNADWMSTPAVPPSGSTEVDLELDEAPAADAGPNTVPALGEDSDMIDLNLDMDLTPPDATAPASVTDKSKADNDSGMIEFDMSALSVDPDSRSDDNAQAKQPPDTVNDPLNIKLALAQEFHTIGDHEGARSLIKEVIAEATGSLKERAERFLAELG
jgi:pilus assembly protein FimV